MSLDPSSNLLGLAFITGVTTGGLSCLAVQAGLLATSVARQAETDVAAQLAIKHVVAQRKKRSNRKLTKEQRRSERAALATLAQPEKPKRRNAATPIALFLAAKLVAYTVLGVLLGWLGSVLQLSPYSRAALQIGIGIFMLGTAARLFNLHPIFRYFVIEPPRFITRFVRRYAKNSASTIATPLFLGTLTIFIPCGVTQAMMVLAVGTGSPLIGAAIMFAFILGTTPVFFGLAYVATRLGEVLHTRFVQVAGVVVLVLGLVSIEGGLNLMGSPYSFSNLLNSAAVSIAEASGNYQDVAAAQPDASGAITIQASNSGYSPNLIKAPTGKAVSLTVVTSGTTGCTRGFVIPSIGFQGNLPETGQITIKIPASAANGNLRYTCSMGMYSGYFEFT
ncbi:MAG TPA: sulfite exporter TauE/SafE family protein [Candidatus Dormibacteraeota bacterium]